MKSLFKILSILMFAVTINGFAQESPKKVKKTKHVCTTNCKNNKHVLKHGEKKHKCDENCKMEMKSLKMHGEEGHVCDATCKAKM